MTTYRTAFADYLTIATGVSTIFSGLYAVTSGGSLMDSSTEIGYWDGYLKHAIATALTLMALYFFLDQSIKIARRIVESGNSALPRWLVFGIFYVGGMVFFCVFQVLFQSKVFDQLQTSYFVIPLIIWAAVTIPLMIPSSKKKRRR